jgi:uncharacterized protein (TIGR02646 family)
MKYIQKKSIPDFFINDTLNLTIWSEYISTKKRNLKKFILENEQNGVCCYCEKKINIDSTSSHVEHIKPKSLDLINLTFDYNNLLVSCEGNHFNEIGDNSKNTCGQKKEDSFDESNFLNPTIINDIADYFIFDTDTGIISSSTLDSTKADYTYKTLNLNGNNDKLAEARKKAREALIRNFNTLDIEIRKIKLKEFLKNDEKEFITFFRYIFRSFS